MYTMHMYIRYIHVSKNKFGPTAKTYLTKGTCANNVLHHSMTNFVHCTQASTQNCNILLCLLGSSLNPLDYNLGEGREVILVLPIPIPMSTAVVKHFQPAVS